MPVPFILRLSGKDRSHVQQYLSKENPARKMLESATNVSGDTFECECSVDQFRSMLKALRMKRGTNRLVWKLIMQKLQVSTKAKKTRKVVD